MPFEVGAAIPIVYPTSYAALVYRADLCEGETLLVHAAAGGVGLAAVQKRPGSQLDERQITDYLKERLASFKVPRHVYFVEELPMSAQGKVQKSQLKRLHAS